MKKKFLLAALCCMTLAGCVQEKKAELMSNKECSHAGKCWKQQLDEVLPLLGHRNWVLVVDKAFPLQSAPGMIYLNSGEALVPVLKDVLGKIDAASHIKPILYTDAELKVMSDDLVPGIDAFKNELYAAMEGANVQTLKHNDVFERLDAASKLFNVVVIKTENIMPYTSVFIELDCGYWTSDKEDKLRSLMN